jgi:nuclear mRNA export protein PCID2/THP1
VNHRLPREQLAASKKWGALGVVTVLFKMYFKLNQLRQCKFLIAAVEGAGFPPLEPPPPGAPNGVGIGAGFTGFPMAQLVTYRYYAGLLALYDEQYARAGACLTYALAHCHGGYAGNRRRILEALVPVRLLLGQVPSPALLAAHGLTRYAGIVEGVRTGNVAAFTSALAAHRDAFIAGGVYLLLERLQLHVYRTLFRRVARGAGTTRLNLSLLQAALAAASVAPVESDAGTGAGAGASSASAAAPAAPAVVAQQMDVAEVECVVANLIAGKFIRGYLSHRPPVLVVAKGNAFRPLAEVAALAEGGAGGGQ